jgi:hypothetical protein
MEQQTKKGTKATTAVGFCGFLFYTYIVVLDVVQLGLCSRRFAKEIAIVDCAIGGAYIGAVFSQTYRCAVGNILLHIVICFVIQLGESSDKSRCSIS